MKERLNRTPAARLIARFGAAALAHWSGRHVSRVYAWTWPLSKGGTGGLVPLRVRQSIREGARAEGHEIALHEFEPMADEVYDLGEAA
ncbi:hypothetical protein [Brevundimonas sp. A19_0]|uniref:hypothetical protein n=1 Tax=Brevundimonas sp. A19_0 TaxID=2821087 RepID=UPI001AD9EA23|nr:hypothetical protein [Brevundimonas sp. A19_0]MBO9502043.1 hypothetical protein [Brevundimonas sp. A19_0]